MPEDTESLRERVARLTATPGRVTIAAGAELVIVAVDSELSAVFATVQKRLAAGGAVRLVAHGATLECVWPSWVRGADNLLLTELGAYQMPENDSMNATRGMREALRAWLARTVGDAVPGGPEVLFPGAAVRVMNEVLEVRPMLDGVVELHGQQRVEFVPEGSVASQLFAAMTGRDEVGQSALARLRWTAGVTVAGAAGLAFGLLREMQEIAAARANVDVFRRMKATPPSPRGSWLVLIPDLMRVNRHVIELFGLPSLASGELAGILLIGSTRVGERSEADYRTRKGEERWPGLGELRTSLGSLSVAQVIGPESLLEWALRLPSESAVTLRVLARMLRSGPVLPEGNVAHSLMQVAGGLGKLATLDVLRARSAARAAKRLPLDAMNGARVTFVGCQPPAVSAVNTVLQDAGATTIDSLHGVAWGEVPAIGESAASVVVTWTEPDAAAFRRGGSRAIQAGMPVRLRARRRGADARNILILTSYVHRDHLALGFPLLAFQEDLLTVPDVLRKTEKGPFSFRWRPHPSDNQARVEATMSARRGSVELSHGRSLADDVDWSDVVVSSLSSAACEALLADVPVFVHVPPHCDAWARPFHPDRRFFRASEIAGPLTRVVDELRAGAAHVLEPERHARKNFFGDAMVPRAINASLFEDPSGLADGTLTR